MCDARHAAFLSGGAGLARLQNPGEAGRGKEDKKGNKLRYFMALTSRWTQVALCAGWFFLSPVQAAQERPADPKAASPAKVEPTAPAKSMEPVGSKPMEAMVKPKDAPAVAPEKEKSLAEQIKAALDGRAGAVITLGKRANAMSIPSKPAAGAESKIGGVQRTAVRAAERERPMGLEAAKALAGAAHGQSANHGAHWTYQGETGPDRWAEMDPSFGLCAAGQRQSPIHIESSKTLAGEAEDLGFAYAQGAAQVGNNGHTFQVDVADGSVLMARGEAYKLVQFHFHNPSEERIDGRVYPMVVHLVHKSALGKLAVVAVVLDVGTSNPVLAQTIKSLPLDVGDKAGAAAMNPEGLLPPPGSRAYYQFMGSLTTPPCSEGVLWLVMKTPGTVSKAQLELFARFFPMNARPIQALNGRLVREQQ